MRRFSPLAVSLFALVATGAAGVGCTGDDPVTSPPVDPDAGTPTSPTFTIAIASASIALTQSGAVQIDVTVQRTAFDGPINTTASNLPAGVAATPLLIPAGASTGKLTLSALANAVQGTTPITIVASDGEGKIRSEAPASLLVRGTPGALDTTFGSGGKVVAKVGSTGLLVSGVAVQSDGRVLVTGQSDNDFALTRLNTDGTPDAAYGQAGRATADLRGTDNLASLDFPAGVALAPNGNAVVAGYRQNVETSHGVARFLPSGMLDTTFDTKGYSIPAFPIANWNNNLVNAVAVQADSKAVFAGTSMEPGGGKLNAVVARFKNNGALDDTFGTPSGSAKSGWFYGQSVAGVTQDTCEAVTLAPGDKIVAAGKSEENAGNNIFALRVDAAGLPDAAFGGRKGFSTIVFGAPAPSAKTVHTLPDGRVLITVQHGTKIVVVRLGENGLPDTTFGPEGKVTVEVGRSIDGISSIVDASGRMVIVASALDQDGELVVARLLQDGKLDSSFGTNGTFVAKAGVKTVKPNVRIAQLSDGRFVIVTNDVSAAPEVIAYRLWN